MEGDDKNANPQDFYSSYEFIVRVRNNISDQDDVILSWEEVDFYLFS